MFPLGGSNFPTSREELTAAVLSGLSGVLILPGNREAVKLEGGNFPALDRVAIDLTGARAEADRLPPEPRGVGQVQPGPSAAKLDVAGHPITVRSAPVDLDLSAADAKFNYDRDAAGKPVLVLAEARQGQVTVQILQADLKTLIQTGAKEAAAKHGVQIQETHLTLTQLDPRSLAAEIRVKAKKLFVSATVSIRGQLRIDDAMNATVSDLACHGEGMLGDMASALIRPKLDQINGKSYPLSAIALGSVRLRDLQLQVADAVKVTAKFGSDA